MIQPLSFDEYQLLTRKTDVGTSAQDCLKPGFLYYALGIAGETGELLEKIKKLFRDKNGVIDDEFLDMVKKEMGDCLWYHARLADYLGIKFSDVATHNMDKLFERMRRGKLHGDGDNR